MALQPHSLVEGNPATAVLRLQSYPNSSLHPKYFHDFITQVVDDFDGDASAGWFSEGAAGVAFERFPRLFVVYSSGSDRESGFFRDFFSSDANRRSTFFTSSAAASSSGRIPRLIRVRRTA